MTITTKFNVNDLVNYKFGTNKVTSDKYGNLFGFEVIEIFIQQCYGGQQIWYDLRAIHAMTESEFDGGKRVIHLNGFCNGEGRHGVYVRMREDELKLLSPENIALLKAAEQIGDEK